MYIHVFVRMYSTHQKNILSPPSILCGPDRCVTVAGPLRERGGTVSQPFHFSGRTIVQTWCAALHNYHERCSGIAYKQYCGIGTLYFKILTMVTAIIWQPGH